MQWLCRWSAAGGGSSGTFALEGIESGFECCRSAGGGGMCGIRTAESGFIVENAEVEPEKGVCAALEQQNQVLLWKMLKECRRKGYVRH